MNENKDMKELNLEELEQVTGGMAKRPVTAVGIPSANINTPADPK